MKTTIYRCGGCAVISETSFVFCSNCGKMWRGQWYIFSATGIVLMYVLLATLLSVFWMLLYVGVTIGSIAHFIFKQFKIDKKV